MRFLGSAPTVISLVQLLNSRWLAPRRDMSDEVRIPAQPENGARTVSA